MEPLKLITINIAESPMVARRGPDWDFAQQRFGYEELGEQAGQTLARNFSRVGVVRSVQALVEQEPPISPPEDAADFICSTIVSFENSLPFIRGEVGGN